jgi:hypothetical protein
MPLSSNPRIAGVFCLLHACLANVAPAWAADAAPRTNNVAAVRATSPIRLDGVFDEPAWRDAPVLDTFYEVYPGDHTPPPVRTRVRYAYDDRYFYIAAEALDPEASSIRRPFVRRDKVGAGQDYMQFFIDPFGTRRSSQVFRINARGVQTDGTTNEATGTEDDQPDFPFDVATRVVADGWHAELRIPFSSLRFPDDNANDWAIMAYRGWPRGQNLQIASGPITRDANCYMCFATTVTGIRTPANRQVLQLTAHAIFSAQRGAGDDSTRLDPGVDAKWMPRPGWIVDATLNPDFSELEADALQITGNVRNAAGLPEKRAFFLESADLLETPLPFVYTRSIADPDAGVRITRRDANFDATAWYVRDHAGGSVDVPGPFAVGSHVVPQAADVGLARARWTWGRTLSVALDASYRGAGAYANRVAGADLAWFAGPADTLSAQWLASATDDAASAAPRDGEAWQLQWTHGSARTPWTLRKTRISAGFRADNGLLSAADIDRDYAQAGLRFFDVAGFNEVQPQLEFTRERVASSGELVDRSFAPALFFQAPHNAYGTLSWHGADRVRASAGAPVRTLRFLRFDVSVSPGARWIKLHAYGDAGRLMDYGSGQAADGSVLTGEVLLRPLDRLELSGLMSATRMNAIGTDDAFRGDTRMLTAILHHSVAGNLRLQWTDDRARRDPSPGAPERTRSVALVYSHRPSLRRSLYVGINLGRRPADATPPQVRGVDTERVFVKMTVPL